MYIQCARKMSIPWIGLNHTGPATPGIPTEILDFRPSEISSMSNHALAHPELIKITVGISTTKLGITFQHPLFSLDGPSKKLFMCSKKWPVCWSRQGLRETGCFPWAHQQVNLKCGERHRTEEEVAAKEPWERKRFPGLELSLGKCRRQTTTTTTTQKTKTAELLPTSFPFPGLKFSLFSKYENPIWNPSLRSFSIRLSQTHPPHNNCSIL